MVQTDRRKELFRVIGDQGRTRHLRKELGSGSDKQSIDDFFLAVFEQTGKRGFFAGNFVHGCNRGENVFDVFAIGFNVVNDGNDLSGFFETTFEGEPSWGFWESECKDDDDDREDTGGHTAGQHNPWTGGETYQGRRQFQEAVVSIWENPKVSHEAMAIPAAIQIPSMMTW